MASRPGKKLLSVCVLQFRLPVLPESPSQNQSPVEEPKGYRYIGLRAGNRSGTMEEIYRPPRRLATSDGHRQAIQPDGYGLWN